MDTAQSLESESPEVIRGRIEKTRASLEQKLETLETEVRSSVQDASKSVRQTVDNMKKVFDIRHQVESRPWITVGTAFALGVVLGKMTFKSSYAAALRARGYSYGGGSTRTLKRYGASTANWVRDRIQPELDSVKALAIGAAVSYVGDLLRDALPRSFHSRVEPIVESATEKLGGEQMPHGREQDRSGERFDRYQDRYEEDGYTQRGRAERERSRDQEGAGFSSM